MTMQDILMGSWNVWVRNHLAQPPARCARASGSSRLKPNFVSPLAKPFVSEFEPGFRQERHSNPLDSRPVILIPTDFSPTSLEAVERGLAIARRAEGRVLLVHAVHLNLSPYGPADPAWLKTALCREAVDKAQGILRCAQTDGVNAHCIVKQGAPVSVIAKAAERCQAALIVMTAARRKGFQRLFANHTTERVIRQVKCPVMLLQTNNG